MTIPKKSPGIVKEFEKCSTEVKAYFVHFPSLAKEYPWDVVIAYLFSRVELAQNMTIYCGCVKCHKVDSSLAWTAIDNQHLTRKDFKDFYKAIFGKNISKNLESKLEFAEKVRDKIMHGKRVSEDDKRQAVIDVFKYADEFNTEVQNVAQFRPFKSLKGFKGRGKSLDKSTSRWVLKGIGFSGFQ